MSDDEQQQATSVAKEYRHELVGVYRQSANRYGLLFVVTFVALLFTWGYVFLDKYRPGSEYAYSVEGKGLASVESPVVVDEIDGTVSNNAAVVVLEEVQAAADEDEDDNNNDALSIMDRNDDVMKQQQIENYRTGDALILNIHPTHHAGTSFCSTIGRHGINHSIAPEFACMGDKDEVMPRNGTYGSYEEMTSSTNIPWMHNKTGPYVEAIRPYFHMISWEFTGVGSLKTEKRLDTTNWEHPKLLSVIITRDPISRLLASDGIIDKRYPGFNEGTLDRKGWWDYVAYEDIMNTDNFFLRILSGDKRARLKQQQKEENKNKNHISKNKNRTTAEMMSLFPSDLNRAHYDHAVAVLDRFTVVLDLACLTEGMVALAELLHLEGVPSGTSQTRKINYKDKEHLKHLSTRERVGYDDVYDYLLEKNKWDILLYKYSKNISLIRC